MTVQTMTKTIDTLSIGLPKIWRALSLYPLYRHDEQRREYVSAAEAMRTGELTVSEAPQASVPTLHADNTSGKTVFFVAGEVVFGGRQDRIVTESFLVPPGGASIPVACVEAGRWSGSAAFEQRSGLGPRRLRHAGIVGRTNSAVDQTQVWGLVGETLAAAHSSHPTGSLRAVIDRHDDDSHTIVALGPLPGQCGVAIGRGDKVIGVELFTNRTALAAYWEAIIRSYMLDNAGSYEGRPSSGSVLRFIRRKVGELRPAPGRGAGDQLRCATKSTVANALVDAGNLIQLVVLAA